MLVMFFYGHEYEVRGVLRNQNMENNQMFFFQFSHFLFHCTPFIFFPFFILFYPNPGGGHHPEISGGGGHRPLFPTPWIRLCLNLFFFVPFFCSLSSFSPFSSFPFVLLFSILNNSENISPFKKKMCYRVNFLIISVWQRMSSFARMNRVSDKFY